NPHWDLFHEGAPGGESPEQIGARADRVVQRVRGIAGNVLIFSSGHFIRVLTARWLGLAPGVGGRYRLLRSMRRLWATRFTNKSDYKGSRMSTVVRPNSAKVVPMTTNSAAVSQLLRQYGCGPIPFVGTENALYERHLVFDRAIDPKVASAREKFEAIAHSVRDILAQRWVLTKT